MPLDCDVLVVGLGPVGDAVAGLIAQRNHRVIAVETEAGVYPLPRAAVFDHEIMRIFQSLGVAERLLPLCRVPERYEFVTASGDVLLDFPVAGKETVSGWSETYILHQPSVEAALRQRLDELSVDLRIGHSFVGLGQDDDGVDVAIDGPQGRYTVRARIVVGCDGARSPVREAIGTTMFDYGFSENWLVIDALLDGSPVPMPDRAMQICDPARPTTYLKMTGDRYRWEFMMLPGETLEDMRRDDFIQARLAAWDGADSLRIERRAVYRFRGLIAERWRSGRVLVAGDAAHQMPPFAGQGMCSGLRDAGNLAWKISGVLDGTLPFDILDSYQAEREPHARAIIETAIAMGKVICTLDPVLAAHRDADMLARRSAGEQAISTEYPDLHGGFLTETPAAGAFFPQHHIGDLRLDDVLGPGFWLIGRDLPTEAHALLRPIDLESIGLKPFAAGIQDWLTARNAAAVIVRPDRHVFGTGDAGRLVTLFDAALARFRAPA